MSDPGWGTGGQSGGTYPPPGGSYPPPPPSGGSYPPPSGGSYPPPSGGSYPPPGGGYPPPGGGYPAPGGYGGAGFSPPGSGSGNAMASDPSYPVTAGFDSPLQIARWRVIGNPIMAIPHLLLLYVLGAVAGVLGLIAWVAALFTGRVPEGVAGFLAGVLRYQWRVVTFYLYLREPYPAFSVPTGYGEPGGDPAWLNITPPQKLSRLAVFFRGVLIIPQALFGILLGIGFYVAMIVAFFAVLITGRWPEGLRKFVINVLFWSLRVNTWYYMLADPYPPFSIS